MRLFKKRESVTSPTKEKVAGKFAAAILKTQGRWAAYLNRVTANWSPFQKKRALILFCIVMGANSGIALYKGFNGNAGKNAAALLPDKVNVVTLPQDTLVNHAIRTRMKALSLAIDSMSKTDSGRVWLANLKSSRPGLWDSMQTAIRYYR